MGHLLPAAEVRLESPAGRRASLVELYTSEGCSSCPPAEGWLNHLVENPRLWSDFVPVSFHVDYWDRLGWRDRFASPAWTSRQRNYASRWGSDTVYTPGFVLDGREWQHTGDVPPATGNGGKLTAAVNDGKTASVTYHPADGAKANRTVTVALLGFALSSNVRAGENSGRQLRHDFVVLHLETKLVPYPDQPVAFNLPLAPADSTRTAVAVWIDNEGATEQATGGWLK